MNWLSLAPTETLHEGSLMKFAKLSLALCVLLSACADLPALSESAVESDSCLGPRQGCGTLGSQSTWYQPKPGNCYLAQCDGWNPKLGPQPANPPALSPPGQSPPSNPIINNSIDAPNAITEDWAPLQDPVEFGVVGFVELRTSPIFGNPSPNVGLGTRWAKTYTTTLVNGQSWPLFDLETELDSTPMWRPGYSALPNTSWWTSSDFGLNEVYGAMRGTCGDTITPKACQTGTPCTLLRDTPYACGFIRFQNPLNSSAPLQYIWNCTGLCDEAPPNTSQATPTGTTGNNVDGYQTIAYSPEAGPNHKFRTIGIGGVTDPDGDPIQLMITDITQDEPILATAIGSGHTEPDARGLGYPEAQLRAERDGTGDGRIYEIAFIALDGRGGLTPGSVSVCVPHDNSGLSQCKDSGVRYDSFTGALLDSATGKVGRFWQADRDRVQSSPIKNCVNK